SAVLLQHPALHAFIAVFSKYTPTTEIYTLSLHDALPIYGKVVADSVSYSTASSYVSVTPGSRHLQVETPGSSTILIDQTPTFSRSEEHTSELQSRGHLVCRLLLEKKKKI